MMRSRAVGVTAAVVVALAGLAACGGGSSTASPGSTHSPVSVLYAGSLIGLMEGQVGPGFARAAGDDYEGYGAGSTEVAADIASRSKTGDVFISASPTADEALEGSKHGAWVSWYATFGRSPLVIAYNPKSRFATDFRTKPWYRVVTEPGIRVGRTDPTLDPKGILTAEVLQSAQQDYDLPGFAAAVGKSAAVFPEEDLLSRVQSGQLDAGFFYTVESAQDHLPSVSLGKATVAATFTATVLNRAPHPQAAAAFIRYLLTTAKPTLTAGGMTLTQPTVTGDTADVPASLRPLFTG